MPFFISLFYFQTKKFLENEYGVDTHFDWQYRGSSAMILTLTIISSFGAP